VWEVGGLEGAGEDLDCVVLGGDFGEGFWAAALMLDSIVAYRSYEVDIRTISRPMAVICLALVL
jgi:hypothetical protein